MYRATVSSTLQIRVFNREFVGKNVFPVGGGDMPPIFVLGAENVERQRKVEYLKEGPCCSPGQTGIGTYGGTASRLTTSTDSVSAMPGLIKDTLRTSGHSPYNNYNKTNFRFKQARWLTPVTASPTCLTDTEHKTLFARHKGTQKPRVGGVSYVLPDFKTIADRATGFLSTTVVAAAIDGLRDNATLANWTRQGLMLHRDGTPERCLFCDQPLTALRLDTLEAHFNAEYGRLIQQSTRRSRN